MKQLKLFLASIIIFITDKTWIPFCEWLITRSTKKHNNNPEVASKVKKLREALTEYQKAKE